ncbi:enoyl-CoA hydratase/isomerase family protein [Anaerobacillus sp. MEB173]|uniref:enoyl-CoA hydratase/isomerase family protein n=1 Tax=Anaerobacillus sp. MEB173 TaxID=3383345 RepID=UPI003F8EA7AF
MSKVILERENGIAWLIINRPDRRNAVDYDVIEQFNNILTEVEQSNDDKMLVITGEGTNAFCSGGDLSVFHKLETKEQSSEMLTKMGKVLHRLFFFPKPTVAFINGTAVGGGCEIATACDFRLASSHAKMGFVQGTLGITTGWGGASMLLERVHPTNAMQLLMSCKLFSAKEGLEAGFVNHIIEEGQHREGCKEWLSPFLKQSLPVLMAYKKKYTNKFSKDLLLEQILNEIDDCSTLWESDEHHQAVQRFLER